MSRGLQKKWFFSILVFFVLLATTELLLLLVAGLTRPREIAVARGISALVQDERIDPAEVDRFMVANMKRMGIPGALVAVTRNDRILYTAGYGRTTNGPLKPDTALPIASMTKSFTAAAVMQLVEAGVVELDAPVRTYIPDFETADPRGVRITIRHLLSQSSGLANAGLPPPEVSASLAERVQWLRGATLANEPGTTFVYCNDNYNLLALVVERASGMSFAHYLRERLFAPLGLTASRYAASPSELSPADATGYSLIFGSAIPWRMPDEFTGGAAGILSTANDLARWLVLQGNGGRTLAGENLLSPASVAAMHAPAAPGSNYAFGWRLDSLPDGTTYVHHSGKEPPFASHERIFPGSGYAFAFVVNGLHGFNAEAASFMAGLNDLVMGRPAIIAFPYTLAGVPLGAVADNFLAILMVFALTAGFVGVVRSRAWAQRVAGRSGWLVAARCAPYCGVVALVVLLPWWMSVVNRGQPVPWRVINAVWPALVVCTVVWAVAGVSIVAARWLHLRRRP